MELMYNIRVQNIIDEIIYIYIYTYIHTKLCQYMYKEGMDCNWQIINQRKSNLPDKIKPELFQAKAVSVLLNGCTTWTLMNGLEKKLDGNYTRMLKAI